jgi:chemotaxis protein MotB
LIAPFPILIVCFGSGCVSKGKYRTAVAERDDYVGKTETLEERIAGLETDKKALEAGVAALEAETRVLKTKNEILSGENVELDEMVQELGFEKQNLDAELARQKQDADQFQSTYDALVRDLRQEVASGQVEIEQLRDGLKVNVAQEILFASGSAKLDAGGKKVLVKVCEQLKMVPYQIVVSGHTDTNQIRGRLAERYPTNWELGGARAASVVRLFQEEGIEGARLISASLGEFQPLAPNDTPEGRAKNRRIEIRLRPVMPEESAVTPG